jgi:hypothetical protein
MKPQLYPFRYAPALSDHLTSVVPMYSKYYDVITSYEGSKERKYTSEPIQGRDHKCEGNVW